ncbi:MAG: tRNA (adenosine(37)-N6)-dimethylallyltransferase MiaA [Nitrospinota bacterium]|nr:tRNA (adenosine(37)-N6)-dimethylallyltransferase MiaA [Nitrospinota bacterium]
MFDFSNKPLIVILGCTGTGKTKFSIRISRYLKEKGFGLEIIGADARQIFKEISVGTAKPTMHERNLIKHHMIDFLSPHETYNASQYALDCMDILPDIYSGGVFPVLVGGSGLYIQSLVNGIFDGPDSNSYIRENLMMDYEKKGAAYMHKRLNNIDPLSATRIHQNDKKRLIRALEVYEMSGRPLSSYHSDTSKPRFENPLYIGLSLPKEILDSEIEKRVRNMLCSGMVEEADFLVDYSLQNSRIFEGLGFSEASMLSRKEIDFETAVEKITISHRQYAKRQRTWFEKIPRVNWFDISKFDEDVLVQNLASTIKEYLDSNVILS